jgi:hypothetical protein
MKPEITMSEAVAQALKNIPVYNKGLLSAQQDFAATMKVLEPAIKIRKMQLEHFEGIDKVMAKMTQLWKNNRINSLEDFQMSPEITKILSQIATTKFDWDKQYAQEATEGKKYNHAVIAIPVPEQKEFDKKVSQLAAFLKDDPRIIIVLFVLGIFSFLATVYQLADSSSSITKKEFREGVQKVDTMLTIAKELQTATSFDQLQFKIIPITCKVYSRPTETSRIIQVLQKNSAIKIERIVHQWAFVNFTSEADSLPAAGWILKKHLNWRTPTGNLPKVARICTVTNNQNARVY